MYNDAERKAELIAYLKRVRALNTPMQQYSQVVEEENLRTQVQLSADDKDFLSKFHIKF